MSEKFLHSLNLIPGISYGILTRLWSIFHDWQNVWEKADVHTLLRAGIHGLFVDSFLQSRKKIDAERAFEDLWQNDIIAIGRDHSEFPTLLKNIPDPPFLLYRKGEPLDESKKHIAIVGTRKSTPYGEKITMEMAKVLSHCGAVVVSGLAFGIDAKAHQACVQEKKPTIAVLASGLFNIMPSAHTRLSENILATGGTLLSEYPNYNGFHKARYHERNRIISGLSSATLVMEADVKSGALITAYKAMAQGRDVHALPGDIHRNQSKGCLNLIAEGAYPILNIPDTITQLGFTPQPSAQLHFSAQEKKLFDVLKLSPSTTEDLRRKLAFTFSELTFLLTALELKGAITKNRSLLWEVINT